jgi:two-component system OmpR family sensor kinase
MDGAEVVVGKSLQSRLLALLSLAIVVIAGCAAGFTFLSTLNDVHVAQDKQLRQTAHLISRLQTGPVTLATRQRIRGVSLEERIVVRFLNANEPNAGTNGDGAPVFSDRLPDGIHTLRIGTEPWRVFVLTDDKGVRIAVAQQTTVRDASAIRSALRTLLPFALLAPVLLLLVRLLIHTLFEPLRKLAASLGRRPERDLSPLDPAGLPAEVRPLVLEINRLLGRVDRSMLLHRRFVADAAHELRSPLTAMTLQAERLAAADMPDEAQRRMLALSGGLKRTRVMLDQLLALARSQQGTADAVQVPLQQVIRAVIEDLFPLAEERKIDLGVVGSEDALIVAEPLDLRMLVKNLIDNAIRYSPPGGCVDVTVLHGGGTVDLVIDDTGPGIPEAERERVFDPFYRILGNGESGSGLGLAIAHTVADKLGAAISFADAHPSAPGLRVSVRFPAAPPRA